MGEELHPTDRQARRWTPLAAAFPREDLVAKLEFASEASLYTDEFNKVAPAGARLEKSQIVERVNRWWSESVPLRRFCLSFHRLHVHLQREDEGPASLREHTPVEFLLLCALHTEKLLGQMLGENASELFAARLGEVGKRIARGLGVGDRGEFDSALKNALLKTRLFGLTAEKPLPYLFDSDIGLSDPVARRLIMSLANYAMLRNYSAHHDCLDYELIYTHQAKPALEALLVTTLLSLDIKKPRGI